MLNVLPKGMFVVQKVLTGWLTDIEVSPRHNPTPKSFDEAEDFNIRLQEHLRLGWEILGDLVVTPRGCESRYNRVTVLLGHRGGDEFLGQDAHDSVPEAEVNEYDVMINGSPMLRINQALFERQLALGKVDEGSLEDIKDLHKHLWNIKRTCEWASLNHMTHLARHLAFDVDLVDIELQKAWGFEVDAKKRTHWNSIRGCLCLSDQHGNPVHHNECPYHGTMVMEGSDG